MDYCCPFISDCEHLYLLELPFYQNLNWMAPRVLQLDTQTNSYVLGELDTQTNNFVFGELGT